MTRLVRNKEQAIARNNFPLVSVVIPTYNRDFCICDAVDTVLAQTYRKYEVIVIDDGSTDQTKEILQKYGNQIIYIWQENAGVSVARNAGIKRAKGEWIAFLDSDDEWLPEKLEKQIDHILGHPEIVAHATNCTIIHNQERLSFFAIRGNSDFAFEGITISEPFYVVLGRQLFFTSTIMVRKKTLLDAGLFDIEMSLYEDLDCFSRVALLGAWGALNEQFVVMCRKGNGKENLSDQHTANLSTSPESSLRIYEKLLLKKSLLKDSDFKLVKRGVSSNLFALSLIARKNKEYIKSLNLLLSSVLADINLKTILKAIVGGVLGYDLYNAMRLKIKNNNGFRRSS